MLVWLLIKGVGASRSLSPPFQALRQISDVTLGRSCSMLLPCSPCPGYNQFLRIDAMLNSQTSVKLNSLHAERILAAVRKCRSWGRGRACLLPDSAPRRVIAARSRRCCHQSQQWYLALILNRKVHGSALEMAGMVLTRSLLSICQYGWEVHPMDFFFFFGRGKKILFGKATFSLLCLRVWNSRNNMPGTCREQRAEKSLLC